MAGAHAVNGLVWPEGLLLGLLALALLFARAIVNIGVVYLVFRLRRPLSPHIWINISDGRFEIPGVVEFSNLRLTGEW